MASTSTGGEKKWSNTLSWRCHVPSPETGGFPGLQTGGRPLCILDRAGPRWSSRSQRDRPHSRGPWALLGPGRRWGGTQRETRSHQGPGGGCWLGQMPSWGPRLARGSRSKQLWGGDQPCGICAERRGEFCLVSRSLTTLSFRRLVWFNVTAESQQGWGRNYPSWCKKSPGW